MAYPYTPYQTPYYQPYQPPVPDQLAQLRQQQMQAAQQAVPQPQQPAIASAMTPPTIHAEIVQIDGGEEVAAQYPVGVGMSQMMIARDDSAIFVKTATANSYTLDVFEKRPPAPEPAPFNPDEYVRIAELPGLVAAEVQAAVAAMQPAKITRTKKETEAAE